MTLDPSTSYRALRTRDPRFDGLFFVGVTTTGIYCRPVCSARTPRRDRCRFFSTAAAAERDGFRACFVGRPELAPGLASAPELVSRAVRRIAEGVMNDDPVDALASELGVTARHLRQVMVEQLGVSPVELAQTERLALAKRLLQDSSLSLADLAFASGFGSVRRFNSAFRARFGRSPTSVRRDLEGVAEDSSIRLRLDYRPPLAWGALLGFLGQRAIPGIELVESARYQRTVDLGRAQGWVSVEHHPTRAALVATVSASLLGELMVVAARLRRLFDLDARPTEIDGVLARDELLRPLVKATPGLRVPGAFDGFEMAVRAVLGQQVTVKGAGTLCGRLVSRFASPVKTPVGGLGRLFPSPGRLGAVTRAQLSAIGLPGSRARTVLELAEAVTKGLSLERGVELETSLARLGALFGIGPWTTQYVAMRALGWPDAFPAGDLGVLRALRLDGPRAAQERSRAWSPWRAYATLHLWSTLEGTT